MSDHLTEAMEHLVNTWDRDTAYDIGPHLTCHEVEPLADVFRAYDATGLADALMRGHADEDDEGDLHYTGEDR